MISAQPAIPLLVHEDCMGDIKTDLAGQQASLSNISLNTLATSEKLNGLSQQIEILDGTVHENKFVLDEIERNTSSIKTSSSNTATATSSLYSSVGTTADASTENTVIGLLKSIANKL